MNLTRSLKAICCRVLIGVVLFSNAAVLAYACAAPAEDIVAGAVMPEAPACEHLDAQSPNLCVEHCRQGQQSADTARLHVVMATTLAVLYARPAWGDPELPSTARARAPDIACAPPPLPHAVAHCVLRL